MSDLIVRGDAMAYPLSWDHYDRKNGNRHFIAGVESYREYVESLPSVEGLALKQTDTLIIADALRYLAQDSERHLADREKAEGLREQVLTYGASMCDYSGHKNCTEFVEWLTERVMDEEDWDSNAVAYGEIIARKLVKLGVLECKDGYYILECKDGSSQSLTKPNNDCEVDLVSRQAAIDALGEEPEIWNETEEEWAYRDAWVEHVSAIKSLPSAEAVEGDAKSATTTDCISREWVLNKIHAYAEACTTSTGESVGADYCAEIVENAPIIIVSTERTGAWVKVPGYITPGGDPVWECSECGKGRHVYGVEASSYQGDVSDRQWVACPNCGARMVGERPVSE